MTHDEWITAERRISDQLRDASAKLDELERHTAHIPGPVLVRRRTELEAEQDRLHAAHRELVNLDRAGSVR